ncbi:hypothetical protein ABMA27_002332 [Loxostege sticticalis]|uniref:THAP-type domain-containing protein n=1 Tax=Loxostege sticticalis TaxID=481309 RepID=A0ABR3HXE4_LOXSC
MTTCVFRYCKNTTRNVSESSGISFHRFVHHGHPKREKWIKIIQEDRSEDMWFPTKFSYICSAHFQADDFYTTQSGKRFLKKTAIPCSNPSEYAHRNLQACPTSLVEVQISDSESNLDSPREIQLKKDLKKVTDEKKLLANKVKKLQRQNKYLRKKTETLTAILKQLQRKYRMNKQIENELIKKAEVVVSSSNKKIAEKD